MNEDFERTKHREMNNPSNSRTDKKYWEKAQPPMMDSVHKPGSDGKLHYSTSHNDKKPPKHEKETNKIINACGGAGAHNSGAKCAEHGAMDSFHKNNPTGSIKGANSYAHGQRGPDRKAGIAPGPQEACKGQNGKKGCEDHLKKAKMNDLTHQKGTKPGDKDKKPKNKPGGKNKKPSSSPLGSTLSGSSKHKNTKSKPSSSSAKQQKPPKKDHANFPALGGKSSKESPKKSAPKKSYASAAKAAPKSPHKSSSSTTSKSKPKKSKRELRRRLHAKEWMDMEI